MSTTLESARMPTLREKQLGGVAKPKKARKAAKKKVEVKKKKSNK